jgi:hypothetical protein
MTPQEALEKAVAGDVELGPPSSLDYADADQIAVSLVVGGTDEWIVLLRRKTT